MQVKKALALLSKGKVDYQDHSVGDTLAERSAEYLKQYEDADRRILAKQQAEEVSLPFLESLRKKISSVSDAPNDALPVVTRFDLHSGIRKLSERTKKDVGMKRLATVLEKAWHQDPLGSLSLGDVKSLVKSFRDEFPRSAAADAIEAECTRVGMHKLPVAKLTRLASKINSQEDYDAAMQANRLDGDKAEQVRARSFVRSLVSMRVGGTDAADTVADKFLEKNAELEKTADFEFTMQLLQDAATLSDTVANSLDQAAKEAFADGFEEAGQKMHDLSEQLHNWMPGLIDVTDQMQVLPDPKPVAPAPAPAPGKPAPAPKPEKSLEEMQYENDVSDAGIGKKKLLDPRTWFASKGVETIRLARTAAKTADLFAGPLNVDLTTLSEVLNAITAQLAPMAPPGKPNEDPMHEMMESPAQEGLEQELDMELGVPGDGEVAAPELAQGMNVLEEIEQAADEIIEQAPPEAVDYIQHEMAEGHTAPPGTAEWGAEEILNEGHEFAPPTEGWLQEEEQELGLEQGGLPMPDEMGGPMKSPKSPAAPMSMGPGAPMGASKNKKAEDKKKGKGIPLPKGKIKQQQEVSTYAKKVTPSGGGKALKASEIEDKLLEGKTLKMGEVLIRINLNDEVELWEKGAGRACALADLDVAIADFMSMTGMRTAQAAPAAPAPAPAAPPAAPVAPAPDDTTAADMPAADVMQAGLTHYKSLGLGPTEALVALSKDYKDRADMMSPEAQTQALAMAVDLWTSGAPAASAGAPGAAPAAPPPEMPAPVSMAAALKDAQSKMKEPAIRKPKDHVSVPKDLGEDSEGKDLLPSPGKINQSQGKPQGKLSPTDLGEDSSTKDLLPSPGKPKVNHDPKDQAGTSLPDTDLGEDSEGNDPFKTPAATKGH